MSPTVAELPDDVDAPTAMVLAMAGQAARLEARNSDLEAQTNHLALINKASDERIATLTAIVKMLERARYGRRSERLGGAVLDDDQYAFVLDEIETDLLAIQAELQGAAQEHPKCAPRPRKGFAAHLEWVEQVIEPEVPVGCEDLERG